MMNEPNLAVKNPDEEKNLRLVFASLNEIRSTEETFDALIKFSLCNEDKITTLSLNNLKEIKNKEEIKKNFSQINEIFALLPPSLNADSLTLPVVDLKGQLTEIVKYFSNPGFWNKLEILGQLTNLYDSVGLKISGSIKNAIDSEESKELLALYAKTQNPQKMESCSALIQSLLISPAQRMMKYLSLLKDLLNYLKSFDENHAYVPKVQAIVEKLGAYIDKFNKTNVNSAGIDQKGNQLKKADEIARFHADTNPNTKTNPEIWHNTYHNYFQKYNAAPLSFVDSEIRRIKKIKDIAEAKRKSAALSAAIYLPETQAHFFDNKLQTPEIKIETGFSQKNEPSPTPIPIPPEKEKPVADLIKFFETQFKDYKADASSKSLNGCYKIVPKDNKIKDAYIEVHPAHMAANIPRTAPETAREKLIRDMAEAMVKQITDEKGTSAWVAGDEKAVKIMREVYEKAGITVIERKSAEKVIAPQAPQQHVSLASLAATA